MSVNRYSDLPPGCSPSDIPGNRPEDVAAEELYELAYAATRNYGPAMVRAAIEEGIAQAEADYVDDQEARKEPA